MGLVEHYLNLWMHLLDSRMPLIYGPFPVVMGLAGYCGNEDIFEPANLFKYMVRLSGCQVDGEHLREVLVMKKQQTKSHANLQVWVISVFVLEVGFFGMWAKSLGEHSSRPGRLATGMEKLADL